MNSLNDSGALWNYRNIENIGKAHSLLNVKMGILKAKFSLSILENLATLGDSNVGHFKCA